jgi:NitT/TauT family transport system permease protein
MTAQVRSLLAALALPLAALVGFELWFRAGTRVSDTLAPPSEALLALVAALRDGSLLTLTGQTLATMLLGLAIGAGGGLVAGCAIAFSRRLDLTTRYVVEMLRSIPSVALLPLALMIFGFGYRMSIFVVAFATFWPSLILTHSALRQVEPRLIEVARALGLGPVQAARKVLLPSAAPRLLTALRFTAGIALVVAVTCEIASNPQGLGHALMLAQETLRPALMWAYLFWIGLIGFMLNRGLLALERRLFAHRSDVDTTVST